MNCFLCLFLFGGRLFLILSRHRSPAGPGGYAAIVARLRRGLVCREKETFLCLDGSERSQVAIHSTLLRADSDDVPTFPSAFELLLYPSISVISHGDQFDPRQKAKARISRENNAKSTCRREIFLPIFFWAWSMGSGWGLPQGVTSGERRLCETAALGARGIRGRGMEAREV